MIEEVFNLAMALASVAVSLLDPMLQFANGVDLYMEAARSSPLVVSCPPRVQNGSWICSDRRPFPECYLFCPSGLVPAAESQVDCGTYKQDNTTNFSCDLAGVIVVGGLNDNEVPVTQTEVFQPDLGFKTISAAAASTSSSTAPPPATTTPEPADCTTVCKGSTDKVSIGDYCCSHHYCQCDSGYGLDGNCAAGEGFSLCDNACKDECNDPSDCCE